MGSYLPLFTLSVAHDFFPGKVCAGLAFAPTPQSQALLHKTSLLTRKTANGLRVFYDVDQAETLDLYTENPDEPFAFQYRVFSRDLFFKNYTEATLADENALFFFDSKKAKKEKEGAYRLQKGPAVTEADSLPIDSPLLNEILSKKDHLIRPAFIVQIGVSDRRDFGKEYRIRFKARETFWKYYLLGKMARKEAYITDLGNKTEFEFTGSEAVQDHNVALCFRSKTPIPLREKLDQRFQLREKGAGNGKVLIKRLPLAAANQISKESINGKEAAVSEIYVNF